MTNIKRLRTLFNYTQAGLAELLGVSRSAVGMWETSSQVPDYITLRKISDFFRLPTDFIMGYGVFKEWSLIIDNYDDVAFELKNRIPNGFFLPSFSDEKFLVAWIDTQMYNEKDEIQLIRFFDFAIKKVIITKCEEEYEDGCEIGKKLKFDFEFTVLYYDVVKQFYKEELMKNDNQNKNSSISKNGDGTEGRLTPDEQNLIAAYRHADQRSRQVVELTLEPFIPPAQNREAM